MKASHDNAKLQKPQLELELELELGSKLDQIRVGGPDES